MCPMRFILVFFSAILAGYLAWRTVKPSQDEIDAFIIGDSAAEKPIEKGAQRTGFKQAIGDAFWGFVDMASGMYLWRNLKELNKGSKVETSSSSS